MVSEGMWQPFAREVTRRIVSGTYPEGALIPTELEFGAEFGISRTVIREGTKVLVDKGLLLSCRGRGTEVLARSRWRTFDPDVLAARLEVGDRKVVLREVLVLRRNIEPELAAAAASRIDDLGIARLGSALLALESAKADPEDYMLVDEQFHHCIAELGGVVLLGDILNILQAPIRIQRALTGRIPGGNPKVSHRQHRAIFHCIVERDAAGARAAMEEHLRWAEERLDRVLADEVVAVASEVRTKNRPVRPPKKRDI